MSNFSFLPDILQPIADSAMKAEGHVHGDPRASCFHARFALEDVLQRAGWVKRALFLADRVSLVNQAVSAFKAHLPESSPVNLVTEKKEEGHVYVSTYPTMMGLIDQTKGEELRFGVGHFDLVVIDEAHRSVYQKYGAIFRYFDSLLVGLTATPRDEVDKNTYDLFDLTFSFDVNEQVTLAFGVNNLFDTLPQTPTFNGIQVSSTNDGTLLGDNQEQANTYPSTYDVLGRDFFVSASFRF